MYRSRTRPQLAWALLAVSSACAWPGSQPGDAASIAADHTLIVDYSQNCVRELDDDGKEVSRLDEIHGAWDAERLDNGNTLLVEFSVSRVSEVDPRGEIVWSYEDLKNPYAASRLPDGTTLIANTFGGEVRVVDAAGEVVWRYGGIRPFDVERTSAGTYLICDVLKDRVIEVNAAKEIVWQVQGMPNAHDADRLPNGNTIVAENTRVREFDRYGNEVWKKEMTWAVEVNRY